jgi:cyclomaltodextrinase / maltogenic alpha-amylase / neopullulanase
MSGITYLVLAHVLMRKSIVAISLFSCVLCACIHHAAAQALEPPAWAGGAVWYLIMPDRFYNADTGNDPTAADVLLDAEQPWEVSPWGANWYRRSLSETMVHDSFYPAALLRHYGGDIEGIRVKLDYLQSLGVTGIILTPTFESRSSHKFDYASLHHMDRRFGPKLAADTVLLNLEKPEDANTWVFTAADRAFIQLITEIRRRGMRVLLMAQFAHCGADFWAFRDVLKHQERSVFGSWFSITGWDKPETPFHSEFAYQKMWGIDAFPRFRQDTLGLVAGPRNYVFEATRRWMDPDGDGDPSDGIDGWCIDLTSELPTVFWQQWADLCRSINPDVLLVNLESGEASSAAPFDLDMPRSFGEAVSGFVLTGSLTSTMFDAALTDLRRRTTLNGSDALLNLIGSHETDRLASMCANPSLGYDRRNSPLFNPEYVLRKPTAEEREIQKVLLLLQFTLPGAPVIYYGDEAGMWGGDDPDNRKPMLWPDIEYEAEMSFEINGDDRKYPVHFDSSMYHYYRALISLREQFFALRSGNMESLLIDDVASLYAFTRSGGAEKVFVAVNAGNQPQSCTLSHLGLPEGIALHDPLLNQSFYVFRNSVAFVLPPRSATLLVPRYQQ